MSVSIVIICDECDIETQQIDLNSLEELNQLAHVSNAPGWTGTFSDLCPTCTEAGA